ncbi:glucosamine-6-phosphate deaminase [Candidatus Saccharibacteria bacterium]|nr:glucosamine-6-phosphate deaminase [Candidatus Saccharibacteria bacterium]
MRIIVCDNYDEMSRLAAEFVKSQIIMKPNCVLGLATGSTPVGMYKTLAEIKLDFSGVTSFNLDDYYPIERANPQGYFYFMKEHFYSKVNIKGENTFIPNSEAKDANAECEKYEKTITEKGGIDLQILGIGQNGHIAFNEPGDELTADTHVVDLAENTIDANSRFFDNRSQVPTQALTMGVATIMKARKIVILASGAGKAAAVKSLLKNKVNTQVPATMLCMHPDVTLICDKEVMGK